MKCWFTPSSVTVCIMKSMIWSELIISLSQGPISRLLFEFFLLRMRPSVFRGLDMKAKWKNTYSIKIKTLEFYKFSSLLPVSAGRGGGGGTPGNFWWVCCSVLKSRPYFKPKNVVFRTRFLPFVISVFIVYYYFNISNVFHITTSTVYIFVHF